MNVLNDNNVLMTLYCGLLGYVLLPGNYSQGYKIQKITLWMFTAMTEILYPFFQSVMYIFNTPIKILQVKFQWKLLQLEYSVFWSTFLMTGLLSYGLQSHYLYKHTCQQGL
jgi:hypothetical protein